jgi:hypothetical protein
VVTLNELLDRDPANAARRRAAVSARQLLALVGAGLYWTGWVLCKLAMAALLLLGGVLFGAGWLARRALWPSLVWCGKAVRLGWQEGRAGQAGRER